jgi:hypothetical protein
LICRYIQYTLYLNNIHSRGATFTLREGKLLRLELSFKDDPVIDLKRADNSVITNLHRGYSYNEVKVYAILRFIRIINISNAGIGVSE